MSNAAGRSPANPAELVRAAWDLFDELAEAAIAGVEVTRASDRLDADRAYVLVAPSRKTARITFSPASGFRAFLDHGNAIGISIPLIFNEAARTFESRNEGDAVGRSAIDELVAAA